MTMDDYIISIDSETDVEHIKTLSKEAKSELLLSTGQAEVIDSHVTKIIEKLTNPSKANRFPTENIAIEDIPF